MSAMEHHSLIWWAIILCIVKEVVFPSILSELNASWFSITLAAILAVPVTVRVFPLVLQLVPEVPVWPEEEIVSDCEKAHGLTKIRVIKRINAFAILLWINALRTKFANCRDEIMWVGFFKLQINLFKSSRKELPTT